MQVKLTKKTYKIFLSDSEKISKIENKLNSFSEKNNRLNIIHLIFRSDF